MPNKFCRYLSNGYSFRFENNVLMAKPCCWFKKSLKVDKDFLTNRKLLSESIDSWTSDCENCRVLEQAGQQSLRMTGADWISDDETSQDPVCIDINLDNKCNAACVMCHEKASNLWAKEKKKYKIHTPWLVPEVNNLDDHLELICKTVDLGKIKYVKFFGGEPLFTDTHLRFINLIPYPEQVTLQYTSNASIYPSDLVLQSWKRFKTIIFSASLDGIEEQFDYVRWPLSWAKVSRNLLRIKNNVDITNLLFRVEFTVNHANAYYYDRLHTWVHENLAANFGGDKTEINIHPCDGPAWRLSNMPLQVRDLVLKKYEPNHVIHKLIAGLPSPTSLSHWHRFVTTWDNKRQNNWKTAFPDLVKILENTQQSTQQPPM